jgi:hypothetical protein
MKTFATAALLTLALGASRADAQYGTNSPVDVRVYYYYPMSSPNPSLSFRPNYNANFPNGTMYVPNSSAFPRYGNGPFPNSGSSPFPRYGNGPFPNAGTSPFPRYGNGPFPNSNR